MTNKNIYRNLGNLDPALIAMAAPAEKAIIPKKNTWVRWASLAACLFLIVGAVIVVPMVWGNKSNVPPNMYDTLNIPAITVQVPSSAPQYYGNENSVSGTLSELVRGDGLSVTARLKEVLPDTYTFYDDWNQTEFRLLRMETIKLLKGKEMTKEFLYIVPVDYMTDFSVYDKFVFVNMGQYGYEYSLLYNQTQKCLDQCNIVICGYSAWKYSFLGTSFQAFDKNGTLDMSLWSSNEKWIQSTKSRWESFEKGFTLSQAETEYCVDQTDISVHLIATLSENAKNALENIKSFENGIFIPDSSPKMYHDTHVSARRYINGFATNERVEISDDTVFSSKAQFTEEDLLALPDLNAARRMVIDAFEKNEIKPAHIKNFEKMTEESNSIFCWYAKTDAGVLGIVRVNWKYNNGNRDCYDDAYYVIEYGSNECSPVDRDTLLEMLGDYETSYIYKHEYTEYGKFIWLL